MNRKVKQVTNLNIKPLQPKKKLKDNINDIIIDKPSEVLNEQLYDAPVNDNKLVSEKLYKAPKYQPKTKFNALYNQPDSINSITDLGSLYDVKSNNDLIILENINEPIQKSTKNIKNQKVNTTPITNNDNIAGDTINLNQINNRQTLINQLISDNQQIISPNTQLNQEL